MSTTKKQHLVWRKYLAPWTDDPSTTDGYIFMLLKKDNKICRPNLMGVGVDNYTYDISMITEQDKQVAITYFKKWLASQTTLDIPLKINDSKETFEKDFIEKNYISIIEGHGNRILNELYNESFPFDKVAIKDRILEIMRLNLNFALMGNPLLSEKECLALALYALEHINDKDERFEFFEFFSSQFLRTWRGQDSVLNAAKEANEKFPDSSFCGTSEALFPLMLAINTFIFASYFTKNNFFIELLKNNTSKDFITGDNPIINLCADYTKANTVSPKKDEWYYPITPKIAIICKNSINKNITSEITDIQQVEAYNLKIAQAATKQVYALTEEDLKEFL